MKVQSLENMYKKTIWAKKGEEKDKVSSYSSHWIMDYSYSQKMSDWRRHLWIEKKSRNLYSGSRVLEDDIKEYTCRAIEWKIKEKRDIIENTKFALETMASKICWKKSQ